MPTTQATARNWKDFVNSNVDFREEDGVFRIGREIFTEPELFDLEMELIFEKTWIYACHGSEIAKPNDFITAQIGRYPMIITRDKEGNLHALSNTCSHRGTTLTRVYKGNQANFVCPFHAWCYKNDGKLLKVKAPSEYSEHTFDKTKYGLKKGLVQSYRGFVFVNLDVNTDISLDDFLGDTRKFLDMMLAQSPTAELEVIEGRSKYEFDANWKLQNENGLDGYHVSTVHYNYVATVQHRQTLNVEKGLETGKTLDYSKLGAGDKQTDDGWFSFKNGHSVLFSDMPNPDVRPGYQSVMPRLLEEYGTETAEWMMHRLRNLNIYPSLFFMDQISSQLRIIRPVAWNKTEIISQCLGVKDESDADRENRIRQFEDFFNVSGMGTPDDLVEFKEAQRGFEARNNKWNDISRGYQNWNYGESKNSKILGITPVVTGAEITHEGLYVNQHKTWQSLMLKGLANRKIQLVEESQ